MANPALSRAPTASTTYTDNDLTPLVLKTPVPATPSPKPTPSPVLPTPTPINNLTLIGEWVYDSEVSWYGPGFYGNRTACGLAYTKTILGVAHRSLPCGTLVEFKYNDKAIVVPVIDRGPYVDGRIWDLSGGLCVFLNHCFTGEIWYRIERK
jgi:hypothetical protein